MRLDIYHHGKGDVDRLASVENLIGKSMFMVKELMATIDDLTSAVSANSAAIDKIVSEIADLKAKISVFQAMPSIDPNQLQSAVDALNASTSKLNQS